MPCTCTNLRARVTGELFLDNERLMTATFHCDDCRQAFRVLCATSSDEGVTTHLRIVPTGRVAEQAQRLAS
jgi:hypothetical protein